MSFDAPVNRRNTHCIKWDGMEAAYGVSPEDGIAMWVADMEFRAPDCIQDAVAAMHDHGVYGYFGNASPYTDAIRWWMRTRHGWDVSADAILTTHGLVNGTALCVDAYTVPGDAVVLFTPVYHAFARVIKAAGREVRSCELVNDKGRYEMDFDAYDAQMTGNERMVILCSPHNPGGRVWTRAELQAVAAFAKRHELVLVSDEIHHDLVMPGQTHIPMAHIAGIEDRLVMMTAATKTFNIAGSHTGNVIIPDADLRAPFAARMAALGISPNSFGLHMTTAAYSPEGAAWVDDLCLYLDENRKLFDAGVNAIPGVHSMPLESTYLAWVDFAGTGMTQEEVIRRVQKEARIAPNHGTTFGQGGESFLRFNIGAPRAQIADAVDRLQKAFADLQ
ncbi:MalY/PatB family protein [Loktanella sp. DJP18]|uniref:MalY/PatB family protein n=1 Tax=Loktanella sp. DJP18 TaxID=3409788 RepID=UPI003BB579B6